jgi:hypothetical protein
MGEEGTVNIKVSIVAAALLLPFAATGQIYGNPNGQKYDAYGRPLPSVESLCREGQMAGGPVTRACAMYGYRFNAKGEKITRYDFNQWGYNLIAGAVTEKDAQLLDSDPSFRAKYIKQHGYDKYKKGEKPAGQPDGDALCNPEADFVYKFAQDFKSGKTTIESARAEVTRSFFPDPKMLEMGSDPSNYEKVVEFNKIAEVHNKKMAKLNIAYISLTQGHTPEYVRDAALQYCYGHPPQLSQ